MSDKLLYRAGNQFLQIHKPEHYDSESYFFFLCRLEGVAPCVTTTWPSCMSCSVGGEVNTCTGKHLIVAPSKSTLLLYSDGLVLITVRTSTL